MTRIRRTFALAALLALSPTLFPESAGAGSPDRPGPSSMTYQGFKDWVRDTRSAHDYRAASTGRVVARFSSDGAALKVARERGWSVINRVDGAGTVVLKQPPRASAASFSRALSRLPGVRYAEPDGPVRPFGQTVDWGAAAMRAPEAHASHGATGAGVVVAVVDTGVDYTHEDLSANIWSNPGEVPGNGIDDDGNGYVDDVRGWDFVGSSSSSSPEDNDPIDVLGHGTHVAGIVAAQDNSVGVVGVAPRATIMPVRVLDDFGSGFDSTIAKGIRYAAANGADVINLSLGGYERSSTMREAVSYAESLGVAVVAAAGNEFFYSIPSYPAGFPEVISVAASRRARPAEKTWWSNWGNVDFLAPGEEVLSTTPDDNYQRFSGTSMASPHVAGALALIKQVHPGFTPAQLEQALAATADDVSFPGKDDVAGSGFPNVEAATGVLPSPQTELYRDLAVVPSDGSTGSRITLRILGSAGDPLSGAGGSFATDMGTLSASTFTTDASGVATTTLTVDQGFGVATVTASPSGLASRSIQVIVEDDHIRVDDALVIRSTADSGGGGRVVSASEPGKTAPPDAGGSAPATLDLGPGDDVLVRAYLGNHHFNDPKQASVTFDVAAPDGSPVPGLSGSIEPTTVGSGFSILWFSQTPVDSTLLRIPDDAPSGRYVLTVTATTVDTGRTDTYSAPFLVNRPAKVLVVRSPASLNAETFNFGDFFAPLRDWGYKRILDDLGLPFAFWDMGRLGQPSAEEMARYSTVLWLGGLEGDLALPAVRTFLEAGGNLLVSGEWYGSFDRMNPSSTHRDFLRTTGMLVTSLPDDHNHEIYPASVSGAGPFAGVTLDINSYDLGTTGEGTALFNDELLEYAGDDATPLFFYPSGIHSPTLAGVGVDTGSSRAIYLSFGIEAVDDHGGTRTSAQFLSDLMDWFDPAPSISAVSPATLTTAGGEFEISGDNFQQRGATTVRVGTRTVRATVLGRTTISARLPRGFRPGRYDVRVVNPIGGTALAANALRVVPAPLIDSAAPDFASNDRARSLQVSGSYFAAGARVYVAGKRIPASVRGPSSIAATLPKGFSRLGLRDLRVTNPDGRSAVGRNLLLVRYGFTSGMGLGARGAAVGHLQRRLLEYGYFTGRIGERFDLATKRALQRYQRARRLSATGFLGRATRARLNDDR
ncbi:MAG: S8 family serine peptidase [Acidobacteria bacterium]|nr:S8 family serine peptidase [Acidobacteriota bacterium]